MEVSSVKGTAEWATLPNQTVNIRGTKTVLIISGPPLGLGGNFSTVDCYPSRMRYHSLRMVAGELPPPHHPINFKCFAGPRVLTRAGDNRTGHAIFFTAVALGGASLNSPLGPIQSGRLPKKKIPVDTEAGVRRRGRPLLLAGNCLFRRCLRDGGFPLMPSLNIKSSIIVSIFYGV